VQKASSVKTILKNGLIPCGCQNKLKTDRQFCNENFEILQPRKKLNVNQKEGKA